MATKKSKTSKSQARLSELKKTVSTTASSVIDDIDKASDVVVKEIRDGFGTVSAKAKSAAKTAADTSVNVKDMVAESHPKEMFLSLVDEVEEIADSIVNVVKERFNMLTASAGDAQKKKTTKKKTAKKATKKKAVKKKAAKKAVKKKSVKKAVKKKAVKKKAPAKKAAKKKKEKKKEAKKATNNKTVNKK